jgi:hypothetical protein
MSFRFTLFAVAATVLAAASPAYAEVSLNFSGLDGSSNPLTIPLGDGNTVTFDSPSGSGVFVVGPTGEFSFADGLNDIGYNTTTFAGDPLTITFSAPLTDSIDLEFGILDAFEGYGSDFLTITPNNGPSIVANGTPDGLALDNPEGSVLIVAPGATSLTITSDNPFSIATVPEPMTLSVLGLGLAGLAAVRRRRA